MYQLRGFTRNCLHDIVLFCTCDDTGEKRCRNLFWTGTSVRNHKGYSMWGCTFSKCEQLSSLL